MEGSSPTRIRIEDFVMWSSLAIYFAVWTFALSAWRPGLILPACFLALVYVGFHIYEITKRHHCYLSADSSAAPAACLTAVAMVFVLFDSARDRMLFAGHFAVAFIVGHLASLLYSFALGGLLSWIYRNRIRSERERGTGVLPGG